MVREYFRQASLSRQSGVGTIRKANTEEVGLTFLGRLSEQATSLRTVVPTSAPVLNKDENGEIRS